MLHGFVPPPSLPELGSGLVEGLGDVVGSVEGLGDVVGSVEGLGDEVGSVEGLGDVVGAGLESGTVTSMTSGVGLGVAVGVTFVAHPPESLTVILAPSEASMPPLLSVKRHTAYQPFISLGMS